jgi:hypothetical protein
VEEVRMMRVSKMMVEWKDDKEEIGKSFEIFLKILKI